MACSLYKAMEWSYLDELWSLDHGNVTCRICDSDGEERL